VLACNDVHNRFVVIITYIAKWGFRFSDSGIINNLSKRGSIGDPATVAVWTKGKGKKREGEEELDWIGLVRMSEEQNAVERRRW
jgi:hypothetical protein